MSVHMMKKKKLCRCPRQGFPQLLYKKYMYKAHQSCRAKKIYIK
jgi:hypothetical protein